MWVDWIETSWGIITLEYNDNYLISLSFGKRESLYTFKKNSFISKQLNEYFSGERRKFEFDFDFSKLTKFTGKVLYYIQSIPYGETMTYGDVAKVMNTSPRAIGVAMRLNPLPIFIPCHRIVAKNSIGGYSIGIEIKKKLLKLENKNFK
jgi:methylated-DNA-[protein]-cysteine S-methyltransferase